MCIRDSPKTVAILTNDSVLLGVEQVKSNVKLAVAGSEKPGWNVDETMVVRCFLAYLITYFFETRFEFTL